MKRIPNPNAGKFKLPESYKDIGWQMTPNNPDFKSCHQAGHTQRTGELTEFDNSMFLNRCTDIITSCSVCKHVWHTDMSD